MVEPLLLPCGKLDKVKLYTVQSSGEILWTINAFWRANALGTSRYRCRIKVNSVGSRSFDSTCGWEYLPV